jgi:hypothetical protein
MTLLLMPDIHHVYQNPARGVNSFSSSIKHPIRCTMNLIFIALSRRHRSTCFGHYCAHHQEPPPLPNCLCSLWLLYDCRVGHVSSCGQFTSVNQPQLETRPTRQSYGNQRLQRQLGEGGLLMMGTIVPETC